MTFARTSSFWWYMSLVYENRWISLWRLSKNWRSHKEALYKNTNRNGSDLNSRLTSKHKSNNVHWKKNCGICKETRVHVVTPTPHLYLMYLLRTEGRRALWDRDAWNKMAFNPNSIAVLSELLKPAGDDSDSSDVRQIIPYKWFLRNTLHKQRMWVWFVVARRMKGSQQRKGQLQ